MDYIRLSAWAGAHDVSRQTATHWALRGWIPVDRRIAGVILIQADTAVPSLDMRRKTGRKKRSKLIPQK